MDMITKNFLDEFSENYNFTKMSESDQFELFSNYCIINKVYDSISFELRETLTGSATQGIDGIAILVNNKLCTSRKEIEDIVEMNRVLNAHFIIIQSKTSSSFSSEVVSSMFDWTKNFFVGEEKIFKTDEMRNFIDMKKCIYENSKYMKERSPLCSLYYVSTGKWVDDENIMHRCQALSIGARH